MSFYLGVHLTEVRPGRPSGECFVEVQSQEDVEEALKKDKENMGKRYIEGKFIICISKCLTAGQGAGSDIEAPDIGCLY